MGCMTSVQKETEKDMIKQAEKLVDVFSDMGNVHNGVADTQTDITEAAIQENFVENQNEVNEMIDEIDEMFDGVHDGWNIEQDVGEGETMDEQVRVLMLQEQLNMLDDDEEDTDDEVRAIVTLALLSTI